MHEHRPMGCSGCRTGQGNAVFFLLYASYQIELGPFIRPQNSSANVIQIYSNLKEIYYKNP